MINETRPRAQLAPQTKPYPQAPANVQNYQSNTATINVPTSYRIPQSEVNEGYHQPSPQKTGHINHLLEADRLGNPLNRKVEPPVNVQAQRVYANNSGNPLEYSPRRGQSQAMSRGDNYTQISGLTQPSKKVYNYDDFQYSDDED